MSREEPTDELLVALDQFTNAVYWLQARTDYTAAHALAEAVTDRTEDGHESITDDVDEADLNDTLSTFLAAVGDVPVEHALADALNAWSYAVSAEHHHSTPFQDPLPRSFGAS